MDGWTCEPTNGWTDGLDLSGWTDGCKDGWTDESTNGLMDVQTYGWVNGMDKWTDGRPFRTDAHIGLPTYVLVENEMIQ